MLELQPLISSKVRRSLLEHFLSHPGERFYLRGLAKSLNLSVSPARRELLRLEQLGVLTAYDEANVRFYVLNPSSQIVTQLTVRQPSHTPEAAEPAQEASPARAPEWPVAATVLSHAKVERIRRALTPAVRWPLVAGAAVVVLVMVALGVASYREMTQTTVMNPSAKATEVSASGEMHSSRWRITPGGVGAFGY